MKLFDRSFRCAAAPFLLLAFLLSPAPPARAAQGDVDQYYSYGRAAILSGAESEALQWFEKAVAENPDHLEARYYLGVLYSGNINTYAKAEEQLLDIPTRQTRLGVRSRNDLIVRSGIALGKLYVKSGRSTQAIRVLRNVIGSAPPDVAVDDAYAILGLALYYERLYDDAIFELRRALKLNPRNTLATFNLKTIRTRLEHFNAAKIYSRMGEADEAILEFRKAIDIDPRFVEARYRLGMELLAKKQPAEALKELRRAEMISAHYRKAYEIRYAEGLALRDMGQPGAAGQMFTRVIEEKPSFAPPYNELGKIQLRVRDYKSATQSFALAIQLAPKPEYVQNLQMAIAGDAMQGAAAASAAGK